MEGTDYDLLVDEDLHDRGAAALEGYAAVITGAHPEYSSRQLLGAYQGYLDQGGHLLYLGGNGFYWVATPVPSQPWVLEVRRGRSGTRAWTSAPGETSVAGTGEPGGLWRDRGRAPQRLVGVGFGSQGGADAAGYRRADPLDPDVAWVFAGTSDRPVFGTAGWLGGAAGTELDRADPALGTPPQARLLATSAGLHSDHYQSAVEENPVMEAGRGGRTDPRVRADLVLTPMPGGGFVFAVGSIDWTSALADDPDVATITRNVLHRALRDAHR